MEHMNRRDFPGAGLGTMMGAPLLLARTGAPLDTELKNGEQNRQTAAKALWCHRFGVNYTPTQNWLFFWNDFDADSVARDLDAIAALGMDHFRILAMWPYFQPNRTWVSRDTSTA